MAGPGWAGPGGQRAGSRPAPAACRAGDRQQLTVHATFGGHSILITALSNCFFQIMLYKNGELDIHIFAAGALLTNAQTTQLHIVSFNSLI